MWSAVLVKQQQRTIGWTVRAYWHFLGVGESSRSEQVNRQFLPARAPARRGSRLVPSRAVETSTSDELSRNDNPHRHYSGGHERITTGTTTLTSFGKAKLNQRSALSNRVRSSPHVINGKAWTCGLRGAGKR
jgi:hypothetical protein